MIVFLLVMILLAIIAPGLFRLAFGLIGLIIIIALISAAHSETWRKDTYGYETYRNEKGDAWKRDRYGTETWRSDRGQVCEKNAYGGGTVCR